MADLIKLTKKKLLELNPLKIPTEGRCPKCGSSVKVVTSLSGNFLVCSNPLCDYYEKLSGQKIEL